MRLTKDKKVRSKVINLATLTKGVRMREDKVNHPSHYADTKIEVIKYIQDKLSSEQFEGYCVGNVLKYVSRYRKKGGVEDLKKAEWYLKRIIKQKEKD